VNAFYARFRRNGRDRPVIAQNRKPNTLLAAVRYFDADTATAFVQSIKWSDGPFCPKCGSVNVGHIQSRGRHQCREKGCRKQFSATTGTIMEATHLKADQWMVAVWMIVNCRNGVSSCEIARTIGCKQQSAWHLLHRVRHILQQDTSEPMRGTVEADGTIVGGLVKNMPKRRRARFTRTHGRGPRAGKAVVHAIRERSSGRVRACVLTGESADELRRVIGESVKPGSRLLTDSANTYSWIRSAGYFHQTVNHAEDEYVRDDVTVNGCENFFNCFRRALKGTYIRPSHGHLSAYVDEAVFRFNVREDSEWERFEKAMQRIVGKRLTYSELTGGAVR
jgi:transposase-like protein